MKLSVFSFLFFGAWIVIAACNSEKKPDAAPAAGTETPAAAPATTTPSAEATPGAVPPTITTTPSPSPEPAPAQNAKGVWHYTCSKGCPGGSGVAGNCPKCSNPLSHNQAYHQQ